VAWWQWRVSLSRNHAAPSGRSCIASKQHGRVWFLSDDYPVEGVPSTLRCSVPLHDCLLIGVPSIDCSTIEAPPVYANTHTGLLECAREDWRAAKPPDNVTLDDVPLSPAGVIVATPVFDFTAPATDNEFMAPGRTTGEAAVYGYVTMLRPLSRGHHTLVAELKYTGTKRNRVTYRLTVG